MTGRRHRRPATARRTTTRKLEIDPIMAMAIEKQRVAFIAKFGREPGKGDPVFFDPDADTPQRISREKWAAIAELTILARAPEAGSPVHGAVYEETFCGVVIEDDWLVAYAEEVDETMDCADCRAVVVADLQSEPPRAPHRRLQPPT